MKRLNCKKFTSCRMQLMLILLSFSILMFSCAGADPRKVDVELKKTPPETKITSFSQALNDLGLMTEIYETGILKIQSNPIGDNTGTSMSTGGEIPRDITEMIKSSLNSIGGNVIYIPYDPSFIQNQMVTGYSGFENKLIPDIVLTGGITEFDRGLETRGEGTDVSAGGELRNLPKYLPSSDVGLRYGSKGKEGVARITLDFNLVDFQTMSGIARMNTVNTMEVHKAQAGKELGISLFGQTFGLKGKVKKVQGRHGAVRLLVELSMIQIVGKHLVIPYWKLLGEDTLPDKVVLNAIKKYYYSLNAAEAIASVQQWLYLYGYNVPLSGELDEATLQALQQLDENFSSAGGAIGEDTFLNVYINIPIEQSTLARLNMRAQAYAARQQIPVEESAEAVVQAPVTEEGQAQVEAAPEEVSAPAQEEAPKRTGRKKIGRILSDEEW